MEKIEKDGKIAVLYSSRHGSGWSTCADSLAQKEFMCMDARIVGPFLDGDKAGAVAAAVAMFPKLKPCFSDSCAKTLEVIWVEKGKAFEVQEFDGMEIVHVVGERTYLTT